VSECRCSNILDRELARPDSFDLTGGTPQMPRESTAFSPPQQPDFVLAAIVGAEPIPRAEITKRVWSYIRANGAQSSRERPQIQATTPQLRALFDGASSCTMFELTKYVDGHLLSTESSKNTSQQDRDRRQKVRLIREEKDPRR
jgi:chromatin remodeling complex protein RSC6